MNPVKTKESSSSLRKQFCQAPVTGDGRSSFPNGECIMFDVAENIVDKVEALLPHRTSKYLQAEIDEDIAKMNPYKGILADAAFIQGVVSIATGSQMAKSYYYHESAKDLQEYSELEEVPN